MPGPNEIQSTITIDIIRNSDPYHCTACGKLRQGMADRLRYTMEDHEHDGMYCPGCLVLILHEFLIGLALDEHRAEADRVRMN